MKEGKILKRTENCPYKQLGAKGFFRLLYWKENFPKEQIYLGKLFRAKELFRLLFKGGKRL